MTKTTNSDHFFWPKVVKSMKLTQVSYIFGISLSSRFEWCVYVVCSEQTKLNDQKRSTLTIFLTKSGQITQVSYIFGIRTWSALVWRALVWCSWYEVILVWSDWKEMAWYEVTGMKYRFVWSDLVWSDWYEVAIFPFGMKWLEKWSDGGMKCLGPYLLI